MTQLHCGWVPSHYPRARGYALTMLGLNMGMERKKWWIFREWDFFYRRRIQARLRMKA